MNYCIVYGCDYDNRNSLRVHRIPISEPLRSIWLEKCGRRSTYKVPDTARICCKHFTSDDYEKRLKDELLQMPVPRRLMQLKPAAVPSLMLPTIRELEIGEPEKKSWSASENNELPTTSPQLNGSISSITTAMSGTLPAASQRLHPYSSLARSVPYRHAGKQCAVSSCSNRQGPGLACFRFPKDKERCHRWVVNTRRKDFIEKFKDGHMQFYKGHAVCAAHFEEHCFMNAVKRNSLTPSAVPTLNLGKSIKVTRPRRTLTTNGVFRRTTTVTPLQINTVLQTKANLQKSMGPVVISTRAGACSPTAPVHTSLGSVCHTEEKGQKQSPISRTSSVIPSILVCPKMEDNQVKQEIIEVKQGIIEDSEIKQEIVDDDQVKQGSIEFVKVKEEIH